MVQLFARSTYNAAPSREPPARPLIRSISASIYHLVRRRAEEVSEPKDLVRKAYDMRAKYRSIAGFAERLVPDTLNRLVAKNQSIQGTNA